MKKIFTLIIGIVFAITILNAQDAPPQAFSFKATIQGANGQTVVEKMIRLRISVLQDDMNGFSAYSEYFTPTTNHYSQVDVEIGRGNVLSGIFSAIDWSAHKYYLKVEVDAKGGTNYQLLSVTQLLSVPYALYAGSAGNAFSGNYEDLFNKPTLFDGTWSSLTGKPSFSTVAMSGSWNDLINRPTTLAGYGITDALSNSHPASVITAIDITNWNTAFNWGDHSGLYRPVSYVPAWSEIIGKPTFTTVATSGSYNDLNNKPTIDGSETKVTAGTKVTVTGVGTVASPYVVNATGQTPGTVAGQMQYWNGSAWVTVAPGIEGQVLSFTGGVPTWTTTGGGGGGGDVYNPTTGKTWMDRNLGASQVATSSTDVASYGDLYQWGRLSDGHQIRTSASTTTLSSSDTPWHDNFIRALSSPNDWRSPQNDNLWQGVSGINNPCPTGYRLPTEAELDAERLSWGSYNAAGAIASPLKLPVAGSRHYFFGSLGSVGSDGSYWSGTVAGAYSRYLFFFSTDATMNSGSRAAGNSVRCLKD